MFKHDNWNCESDDMGSLWDDLVAKVNTTQTKAAVQAAIDRNKQLAINAAVAKASDAAGKILATTKATDPKNQALIDKFIGSSVAAAQDSFFEKNKIYFYVAGGVSLAAIAAFIIIKKRKKVA
jgi:LPXTG-motif cell wall-anchored protein